MIYCIIVSGSNRTNVLPPYLPSLLRGFHVWQAPPFFFTACLASSLLETVSHISLLHCLVLSMLTWENIRSTHAEECGNATSVHISLERTSNFGLALQSVICFSSSQNAGGFISAGCSRSPLYAGSSLHWSQRRSRWSSETTVGNRTMRVE